jgi:hypothetical protein
MCGSCACKCNVKWYFLREDRILQVIIILIHILYHEASELLSKLV